VLQAGGQPSQPAGRADARRGSHVVRHRSRRPLAPSRPGLAQRPRL